MRTNKIEKPKLIREIEESFVNGNFSWGAQKIITNAFALSKLAKKMENIEECSFDTETNTLDVGGMNPEFSLVGVSITFGYFDNYYIPLGHLREEDMYNQVSLDAFVSYFRPIFERTNIRLIAANAKYDMHVLKQVGINVQTKDIFCILNASWLCDENRAVDLKGLVSHFFKEKASKFKDIVEMVPNEVKKAFGLKANSKAPFSLVLIEEGAPYAIADSFNTWRIYHLLLDELEKEKMWDIYFKKYVPYITVLYKKESRGIEVDLKVLNEMEVNINKDLDKLLYQMTDIVGVEFNPSSSAQLAVILFGIDTEKNSNARLMPYSFNLKPKNFTPKGAPQTALSVIWDIYTSESRIKKSAKEFCKYLYEYKKLEKLRSSFISGLREKLYNDNKAHPSFKAYGTDSGRLSCSKPNLQQLPNADEDSVYKIRSLFRGSIDPATGKRKKIISADFSNLEMRILAHFSKDEILMAMFRNHEDAHGSTAVNMFNLECDASEVKKKHPELRQAAKTINFMLMYGGGAKALHDNLKFDQFSPIDLGADEYLKKYKLEDGVQVAQKYIDIYFEKYCGVAKFIRNQKNFARKHGFVYTLIKRKRRLPDILSKNFAMASYNERLSVNSAIQGSAADITESAQLRIDEDPWFEENGVYMLLQVHDELVFECPEEHIEVAKEKLKRYMSHPFGDDVELNVPLDIEVGYGDNYYEAK
jgi:DNA polymerase-1